MLISSDHTSVEIHLMRSASMHVNTVNLLETPPWSTCLVINNIHEVEPLVLEADITLTHPYPGFPKFTGFDVRGIFIAQSDFIFPTCGRGVGTGDGVPRMLNPDGFTQLFNPTEFPESGPAPPIFEYIPGKYATGGDLSATLNPFIAYRREAPRRMFEDGGSETRTVRIYAPPGPIHFGYAVDACWEPVDEVVDPLTDFPPEANCLEAYKISINLEDSNSSVGSVAPVSVEVFDHQGLDTISSVSVEIPYLFPGQEFLSFSEQTGDNSFLFTGNVSNTTGAIWGDYPVVVRVIDKALDPNLGAIDAWFVDNAHVKQGWARSWGGGYWNRIEGVATDSSGDILVSGAFNDVADLDPGPGEDIHYSNGYYDATLSKFDTNGIFKWARSWGGSGGCESSGMAVDSFGNSYVIGYFSGTTDFDPGAGEAIRTSDVDWDLFLSKFSPDGDFQWVQTWQYEEILYIPSIAISNSGGVFIAGHFNGTIDFDPGPGEDIRTSSFAYDAVLMKLDDAGNYHWAHIWGPKTKASSAAVDNNGNVFVTGYFAKLVDFDPGPLEEIHTPAGPGDAFLSMFNSNGDFLGVQTWGGFEYITEGFGVTVSEADVYITGTFGGTVDMDPGPAEDNHVANPGTGTMDAFLSRFSTSGIFQWARSWGGPGSDLTEAVAADSSIIYVIGTFSGTVDLDPGPGIDTHTTEATRHMYLTCLTLSGDFIWANSWDTGSIAVNDGIRALCIDSTSMAYIAGCFIGTVDFDPTLGIDNHSAPGTSYSYAAFLSKNLPDGTW